MGQIDWYVVMILVGLLLSIPHFFLLKQYKKQHLIIFIILLLATSLESYGSYTVIRKINNMVAYNLIFAYTETILILSFFYSFFESKRVLRIVKIASFLFLGWGIIYSVFFENLYTFHAYSFYIGSFIIILCCIYFFISIFLNEWFISENLVINPLFWITTFIFLFYTSTLMYFSSVTILNNMDRHLLSILGYLKRTMAILMYLCMGLAFYLPLIWKEKKRLSQK